jgi:hypothetical protein
MKNVHSKFPYQELSSALRIQKSKALFRHLLLNIINLDKGLLESVTFIVIFIYSFFKYVF